MDNWEHSHSSSFPIVQMSLTLLMPLFSFCSCVDGIIVVLASRVGCSIFLAFPFCLVLPRVSWVWPAEYNPAMRHIWISFLDCCGFHQGLLTPLLCQIVTYRNGRVRTYSSTLFILVPSYVFLQTALSIFLPALIAVRIWNIRRRIRMTNIILEYFLGLFLFFLFFALLQFTADDTSAAFSEPKI